MNLSDSPSAGPQISARAYRGEYGSHSHAHSQVLVGLRGSLQLEVDGRPAFVDPSCGLVIPAGSRHSYLADAAAEMWVVDCDYAQGTDRLRRFALPPRWQTERAALTAAALLEELVDTPTLQIRRRLNLAALQQQVDAELHRGWTIDELATLCCFSPQRFRARFAEVTGMPPLAWVRQRRLDQAQRLLRSGLQLGRVAMQVGYANASALCFALRRERGVGARQLRVSPDPVRASLDT